MTGSSRSNLNPAFIATSAILLLILFIRVSRGVDLTDEMQYYGEIKGLIETGRLFSNDLFIQQSVYILLYPAFCLYHWVFGFDGFVLFGRLVMALLSIAVFVYAFRKCLGFNFSAPVASLTALSVTFAIPYHGIFAPSYNTIAQVLWIVFTLRFFEWKQSSLISWAALPVIMVFAHPGSAVMMSLLIAGRLLVEHESKKAVKWLAILLGSALLAIPVMGSFATQQQYLASLAFSSGYGVGTAFFASKAEPIMLLVIYAMFGACLVLGRRLFGLNVALFAGLFGAVAIMLLSAGLAGAAYSARVAFVLSSLSALAYAWSLSNIGDSDIRARRRNHWLVAALLAYATTLGVTSGNGIGQATGAFMVGLPLLLGIAVSSARNHASSPGLSMLNCVCVVFVLFLFVVHWSRYPYREDSWWNTNQVIQSVPEFGLISTSLERAAFIQRMRHELAGVTRGRRTLMVSEYPGLYFALGARPETCMLYMHSLTSDRAEAALLDCLNKKKPEIVVDILGNNDIAQEDSRIKRVMRSYYYQPGVKCAAWLIKFNPIAKVNAERLKYSVCTNGLFRNVEGAEKRLMAEVPASVIGNRVKSSR